jgi:predicted AlkP superfamily phosphohydrolase/phosphomutase
LVKKHLYLIGIDSAPLWLIKELSEKGSLQGFKKILAMGSLIEMDTTLPPMTGAAWPTIYTGKNPSVHGVPDFFEMKSDYTPDLAFYDSDKTPPFWKKLCDNNLKSLIITPAMDTKVPSYKNLDFISGFPLKAKPNSKLMELLTKKENFTGEPDIEKDMKAGKMSEKEAVTHFVKSITSRSKIAKEAMEKKNYDFVYVCFTETDRLQHFVLNMRDYPEYLLPIYKAIDNFIQICIARAEKENGVVMIVSDHGAQPIKEKLLINSWLIKNNFASLKDSILKSISSSYNKNENAPLSYSIREKAMKTGLRKVYDKLPHGAKKLVHKSVGKVLSSASSGDYTRLHLFDYNMEKTVAFAGISNINVATIFINDKRFKNGIVKPNEVNKIKLLLSKSLLQITDKNGKKIIKGIYDATKYYTTKPSFIAPDLFVEAMPGYSIDIFNFSKKTNFMSPEPPKRGDHTRMAVFGVLSPNKKTKLSSIKITDISTMILKYFSL